MCVVAAAHSMCLLALLKGRAAHVGPKGRVWLVSGWALSVAFLSLGFLLRFHRVAVHFAPWFASWGRGLAILWAFFSMLMLAAWGVSRLIPRPRLSHSPGRRAFLRSARLAVLGAPAVATGYGTFVQRFRLNLREENIAVPGLPKDLEGLRLVQLSDIHLSPFLSVRELDRAIDIANETRAHIALVTGDLITTESDPLDDCLNRLTRLRADAGIFGCMGNHEIYAGSEQYTQEQGARLGMHFLRSQSRLLRFGATDLNLAGVDYQRSGKPYLPGAETMIVPSAFNLLLSHNPDVFPVAARKGFQFTMSGHTHGGQVRVEILNHDLSVARFFTPYVDGLYRQGESSIFVSRGIGTIGLPARLGAPPEVALLRLCRT